MGSGREGEIIVSLYIYSDRIYNPFPCAYHSDLKIILSFISSFFNCLYIQNKNVLLNRSIIFLCYWKNKLSNSLNIVLIISRPVSPVLLLNLLLYIIFLGLHDDPGTSIKLALLCTSVLFTYGNANALICMKSSLLKV